VGDWLLHLACQGENSPLCPQSVTPLAMMYRNYTQQSVTIQLQQDTSWWCSFIYGRACKLSN